MNSALTDFSEESQPVPVEVKAWLMAEHAKPEEKVYSFSLKVSEDCALSAPPWLGVLHSTPRLPSCGASGSLGTPDRFGSVSLHRGGRGDPLLAHTGCKPWIGLVWGGQLRTEPLWNVLTSAVIS